MQPSKFNKGDAVFSAEVEWTDKTVTCPDCLGDRTWLVVFPSGQSQNIDCQTCKRSFEPPSGRLILKEWKPIVRKRTIGSIRYNDTDKSPYSYMCKETGVGSGRVYYETDIYETEEEAKVVAQQKFEEQQLSIAKNNFKTVKQIENMLSTYGYTRSTYPQITTDFKRWIGLSKKK